jgi:hypothetical protein
MLNNYRFFKLNLAAMICFVVWAPASYAISFTFDVNFGNFGANPATECTDVIYGVVNFGQQCFTLSPTGPGYVGTEVTLTKNGNTAYCLVSGTWAPTPTDLLKPKYQVIGVYYAPPGSQSGSSVATYGSSYLMGTSTNFSSTISGGETAKVGGSLKLSNYFSFTASQSSTDTYINTYSNTYTLNSTIAESYNVYGASSDGVNHNNDLIWVWLNPVIALFKTSATPSKTIQIGIYNDGRDPASETGQKHVIVLSVSQLKQLAAGNTAIIASEGLQSLLRSWDSSWASGAGSPALTTADYNDILKADPFVAEPTLNPATSSRFNSVSTVINYDATTTKQSTQYTATAQTTTLESQTAEDDHSGEAVIESTLGVVVDGLTFGLDGSTTGAYTYKNVWTQQNTETSTQNATFTIYAPLVSDGYTGPHSILVFTDNVYGTFAFYGVPGT